MPDAPRLYGCWRVAAAALAALILSLTPTLIPTAHSQPAGETVAARRILHIEPSAYAPIVIYETATRRCMTFHRLDNPDAESCLVRDDPRQIDFDYTRMMVSALIVRPAPRRILLIGVGGATLARTLHELLPHATLDNVEIDPAVVNMAERFFGFERSARQRVHVGDGRAFVQAAAATQTRYDLVLLDAFGSDYIPGPLMTQEFLTLLAQVVAPQGLVVANTAGAGPLYSRETATYLAVFGTLLNLPAQNRIIMATPGTWPDMAQMRANAQRWQPRLTSFGVNARVFFDRMQWLRRNQPTGAPAARAAASVLTDANIADVLDRRAQ